MNLLLSRSALVATTLTIAILVPAAGDELPATRGPDGLRSLRDYVRSIEWRQAFGVYLGQEKLGWIVQEVKLDTHEGREAAVYTNEGRIKAKFLGVESVMDMQSRTVYRLDGDGEIVAASERQEDDGSVLEVRVTREGRQVVITTESAGQTTSRRSRLPLESVRRMWDLDRWLQSRPKAGDTFEDYSTEWIEPEINVKELYTFRREETIVWGGVPTRVYTVQMDVQGIKAEVMVTNAGRLIKGKMVGLFDIRAEEEDMAKDLDGEAIDLLAATRVRLDKELGDPEQVRALTLKVNGLDDFELPLSHRQRLRRSEGGAAVLEVLRDHRIEESRALDKDEREQYLRATSTLPAEHSDIRDLAREIVDNDEDTVGRARRFSAWIHENLRPDYATNASTAFQVLKNRSGDCTEYALLFVALARATRIPAREVGGLVYTGDENGMAWHAWAEIHDGFQWISVDPMWGQVYVDATHIKFSDGVDDWSWVNVVGRLKIEVIDFKTK